MTKSARELALEALELGLEYARDVGVHASEGGNTTYTTDAIAEHVKEIEAAIAALQAQEAEPISDEEVKRRMEAAGFAYECVISDHTAHFFGNMDEARVLLSANPAAPAADPRNLPFPEAAMFAAPTAAEDKAPDDLRIIYENHFGEEVPHGIRDWRGFLFFFPKVYRYEGQDARYEEEKTRQRNLAEYLLKCLIDRAAPAAAESDIRRALKRLSFAAQTSGGTAGPDPELQAAIAKAEIALENYSVRVVDEALRDAISNVTAAEIGKSSDQQECKHRFDADKRCFDCGITGCGKPVALRYGSTTCGASRWLCDECERAAIPPTDKPTDCSGDPTSCPDNEGRVYFMRQKGRDGTWLEVEKAVLENMSEKVRGVFEFRTLFRAPLSAGFELGTTTIADWLDEAAIDIDDWGAYASEYFKEKYNLSGDIEKFERRAKQLRGQS